MTSVSRLLGALDAKLGLSPKFGPISIRRESIYCTIHVGIRIVWLKIFVIYRNTRQENLLCDGKLNFFANIFMAPQ